MKRYYKKNSEVNIIINNRLKILSFIVYFIMMILLINLFYIQIIKKTYYTEKLISLTKNIIEGSTAPRGRIYDRNHILIVDNQPAKVIYYKKNKLNSSEEIVLAYKLAEVIYINHEKMTDKELRMFWVKKNKDKANDKITEEEYKLLEQRKLTNDSIENLKIERISSLELEQFEEIDLKAAYIFTLMNKGYSYSEKIIKNSEVTDLEYAYVASKKDELLGFDVRLDWNRSYPYGDVFKSIIGSVSTSESGIPANLKDYYLEKGYKINDRVGTSYLELQYDDYLKGVKNTYELKVNGELKLLTKGTRGNDIVLTIDIELQKAVEKILKSELTKTKSEANTKYYNRSFVIITNPKTGEILAMAGKQIVEKDGGYKIYDYTPGIITSSVVVGSIIKGASHIVGYNTGALKIGEKRYDTCVKLKGAPIKCSWKSLGMLDDITALKQSSNTFQFYTALKASGVNYYYDMPFNPDSTVFKLYRDTFAEFGLGVETGIDLPLESTGYKGDSKVGGLLLDFAIGQYDNYTPIQLSQYISTIANDGVRLQPYLLKEVYSSEFSLQDKIYEAEVKILNKVNTTEEYMNRVKLGFKAVLEYGGTGSGYIDKKYNPAGKTGTSQSFVDSDSDGVIDKETITNTFAAYAPSDNPVVTFTVVSPDIYYSETNSEYQSNVNRRISKLVSNKYFEIYK